jgi:flagellar biogenesis protein FliO
MKSEPIIYEAVFGDGDIPPSVAAAAPVRHPLGRAAQFRSQFGVERILRITLHLARRLTAAMTRRAPRRLQLCESLPLGERRFVAVVEFERARFLVGGTSASLVLLARLGDGPQESAHQPARQKEGKRKNVLAPNANPEPETSAGAQP